ncbi:hypothetical protein [Murimonas intestini]|uniref:hypothetical protein n=1 Tax=Murimonas intestini TaxID=1337051 RepID=UPI0011DD9ECF|nr:hypothetical protein [Murimonas intestini]
MSNILLIEPNYKNKYPPLGLMKIAYFHKHIMHDYVRFAKGKLPVTLTTTKWDHVYVTTLFTFEWANTIEAINYAKTLVNSIDQITVGGIAATLMPDRLYKETGIYPVLGLLNEPGKLGLKGDECIDQIVPDYSILEDIEYVYPYHDAYFLSATKGCGMKCGFCAVQTLEPTYIPYMDIRHKVEEIDKQFGPKKDLLLMDNNVLRSKNFNKIIDDIIAAGFGKGATYRNPKTGKMVKRYVDFNQGLDANLLTEEKAKRLGEIALKPARVAFDHIEDRNTYEKAMRLCAKYGIRELSNYVLYNSEDFGGKGKAYLADTPENLYDRMRITLDIRDDINKHLSEDQKVAAFSFPMRYIPLSATGRGYVGSQWYAKYLRAVQCMLIPTQGKGVGSRSFFEADFGKSSEDFVRFLAMPEKLIAARGEFSSGGRGRKNETEEELRNRKKVWERNQSKIGIWNMLYDGLGDERESFINLIADNEYLPEKVLGIISDRQKKLYMLYLTTPRLIQLLGLVDRNSPTHMLMFDFIKEECKGLYKDILEVLTGRESQQQYIFLNFAKFFGREEIYDLLCIMEKNGFSQDIILKKWNATCKKYGISYVDFELIRVYKRYVDLNILEPKEKEKAISFIKEMDMPELAAILANQLPNFIQKLNEIIEREKGQAILKLVTKSIYNNIQYKLINVMEDE